MQAPEGRTPGLEEPPEGRTAVGRAGPQDPRPRAASNGRNGGAAEATKPWAPPQQPAAVTNGTINGEG
eukprot:5863439-Lingulodinium_polyedra.AAC.1